MLKRLFILTPLWIIFGISVATLIIPFVYWLIKGEDYVDVVSYKISKL